MYVFVRELQISLEVFGYTLRSSCSGFGRGNRQSTHRRRVLWAATHHRQSEWLVRAVFGSGSGELLRLVGFRVGLDSPTCWFVNNAWDLGKKCKTQIIRAWQTHAKCTFHHQKKKKKILSVCLPSTYNLRFAFFFRFHTLFTNK